MGRVYVAHGGGGALEPELLIFGVAACGLAVVLRRDGNAKAAVVTMLVGLALLIGAFAIPRS